MGFTLFSSGKNGQSRRPNGHRQQARPHLEGLEDRILPSLTPQLLKDINLEDQGSAPSDITAVGATVFFTANDGIHGSQLWRTDGTAAGTILVSDLTSGFPPANPTYLTNVNGSLFFIAYSGQLWESNGDAAGTHLVFRNALYPTNVNGTLFFAGSDQANGIGRELWRTNGTPAGTTLVADIQLGNPGRPTPMI